MNYDKTYNMKIESLNSLLSEALADEELTKLTEEDVKLPEGTEEKKPEEVKPTEPKDPTCTHQEGEDIKPVENDDKAKEVGLEKIVKEDVKIPEGTEEKKPEEAKVTTPDKPPFTHQEGEDVEPVENVDKAKEVGLDKIVKEDVVLPKGVEEKKPVETKTTEPADPTCTHQEGEDVKPVENDDKAKEVGLDKVVKEDVKIPEGTLTKKPEEVKTTEPTDPTCTHQEGEDIKPVENDDKAKEIGLDKVVKEDVKLPEGTEEKKPEEVKPTEPKDPTCTHQEGEDVKPVKNDDALQEAIDKLNSFILNINEEEVKIPEGTEEKKPEEVKTTEPTDPTCTHQEGEDVEPVENIDKAKEATPENKEYHAFHAGHADNGCECEKKDYSSLKEAIALGNVRFKTEEDKKELAEHVALLLANENNDLMYDEYCKLISEAISLKEALIEKYSVIANNRTNSLLENMNIMEEKLKATRDDMFKKLNEQKEINKAKKEAKMIDKEKAAFTKIEEEPKKKEKEEDKK